MNKLSPQEIQTIIEAGNVFGIVDFSILEKDHFVTKAIHTISEVSHSEFNLIFCGGTCLAKAHKVISRMSEDVDFKISPRVNFLTNSEQRRKLEEFRDQLTHLLTASGFEINDKSLRARDNNSYLAYYLEFPSHFEQHNQLKPHIQLEFTLASPQLPTEIKPVSSLVDTVFPYESNVIKNVNCVSIIETAAEKWVALTRRIAAISRGYDPMDETLVRHLYDLYFITSQLKLTDDFLGLAANTINRDRNKFKKHNEYKDDPLREIQHAIELIGSDSSWSNNYTVFIESMVFDKNKIGFDKCLIQLRKITEQIAQHPHFKKQLQLNNIDHKRKNPSLLTTQTVKQLKLYVVMSVKLTEVVEERKKIESDIQQSQ